MDDEQIAWILIRICAVLGAAFGIYDGYETGGLGGAFFGLFIGFISGGLIGFIIGLIVVFLIELWFKFGWVLIIIIIIGVIYLIGNSLWGIRLFNFQLMPY